MLGMVNSNFHQGLCVAFSRERALLTQYLEELGNRAFGI